MATPKALTQIQAAMQVLVRRSNLPRVHDQITRRSGTPLDRGAYATLTRLESIRPARVTDLAHVLGVEPSTATRHVQALETLGYATKAHDPDDGRACLVDLTVAGEAALERIRTARSDLLADVFSDWSTADLATLASLLERFAADLVEYSGNPAVEGTR